MTDTDFIASTRLFYDAVAEDYAERFRDELARRPLERALLGMFAELVGKAGPVADLGCGPGRTTGLLASLGLDVFGLDLSESMLAIARRENPSLRFERGSMLELGLADGSLAGVVSWYSSIHTPVERLPELFAGFHRVLAPGGRLLVGFQAGDVARRHERPWGHAVTLDFQRRRPADMAGWLEGAGFVLHSTTVREPADDETSPQAFLLAQKPRA
ncbi:class I SAM-dependent methyltransferase [Streptomyces mangrovisoli]|uniref:Methyltransferase n=1 Tax=Streptomyces mangrovisoli TaxID=1428628 RepID=A0A1J4NWF0_9ACTN|nr:class I SAM-dependent methyltransferase [Streptomyces mangrovisoli]OIJ66783.1 methyltransferase [Streptomyces mangrovisoli]